MPEPRERIARALSRLQGHPPDIRFEGKPMWQSFLPEADAALAAADIDRILVTDDPVAAANHIRKVVTDSFGLDLRRRSRPSVLLGERRPRSGAGRG